MHLVEQDPRRDAGGRRPARRWWRARSSRAGRDRRRSGLPSRRTTVRTTAGPLVRLGPPRSEWPPPGPSSVRRGSARFIPTPASRWAVRGLGPARTGGPFGPRAGRLVRNDGPPPFQPDRERTPADRGAAKLLVSGRGTGGPPAVQNGPAARLNGLGILGVDQGRGSHGPPSGPPWTGRRSARTEVDRSGGSLALSGPGRPSRGCPARSTRDACRACLPAASSATVAGRPARRSVDRPGRRGRSGA